MGRGRAKAKQTKVARQLKYNTPDMDLDSLQKELASQKPNHGSEYDSDYDSEDDDYSDPYADYVDEWDDEEEEEDSSKR